jgi:GNAT superfamily N-acetyltransferase
MPAINVVTSRIEIRDATFEDVGFLRDMVLEAAYWRPGRRVPSREVALADPKLAHYVDAWGRPGDTAVVAVDTAGVRMGAAWARLFPAADPGYGFIDEQTPELGIAVLRDRHRGGIGGRLLEELVWQLRRSGFTAVSLSVERDNPARRLYERLGFVPFELAGDAITMILRFEAPLLLPTR